MANLKHFDDCNTARFITIACYRKYKLFNHQTVCEAFLQHLDKWSGNQNINLLGYIIMPNHVHLVLYPQVPVKMGRAIGLLKSAFAFEVIAGWKKINAPRLDRLVVRRGGKIKHAFWETLCYDHNCRTPESVLAKIQYCHNNPVRAGLVQSPEDWPWSSYRWYNSDRPGKIRIDSLPDLI